MWSITHVRKLRKNLTLILWMTLILQLIIEIIVMNFIKYYLCFVDRSTDNFYYSSEHFSIEFWNSVASDFTEKTETKRELSQIPPTHSPITCSRAVTCLHPLLGGAHPSQPFHLYPESPTPFPLTQGHYHSNSPLFASSTLPLLLCHSHYHTNVLFFPPLKKTLDPTFSLGLHPFICFPLQVSLIPTFPFLEPTLPWFSPYSLHQNWSCQMTNDLLVAKSDVRFSVFSLLGHQLMQSLSFLWNAFFTWLPHSPGFISSVATTSQAPLLALPHFSPVSTL